MQFNMQCNSPSSGIGAYSSEERNCISGGPFSECSRGAAYVVMLHLIRVRVNYYGTKYFYIQPF